MRTLGFVIIAGYLCAAAAHAQQAERKPENVQVLTGLSLKDVRAEMTMMSEALDVKCSHCHVQGDFASDANRNKITARRMLQMTRSLNELYFAAAPATEGTTLGHVTCYTCHRGAARPLNSPTFATTK